MPVNTNNLDKSSTYSNCSEIEEENLELKLNNTIADNLYQELSEHYRNCRSDKGHEISMNGWLKLRKRKLINSNNKLTHINEQLTLTNQNLSNNLGECLNRYKDQQQYEDNMDHLQALNNTTQAQQNEFDNQTNYLCRDNDSLHSENQALKDQNEILMVTVTVMAFIIGCIIIFNMLRNKTLQQSVKNIGSKVQNAALDCSEFIGNSYRRLTTSSSSQDNDSSSQAFLCPPSPRNLKDLSSEEAKIERITSL